MLSFGSNERSTQPREDWQTSVLNALRQSEENHCSGTPTVKGLDRCSTPYGNQRKITPILEHPTSESLKCSTPYGNQRKITPDCLNAVVQANSSCSTPYGNQRKITNYHTFREEPVRLCSTPYGNQRKITLGVSWGVVRLSSAQRLTAIRGKSRPNRPHRLQGRPTCSTPYGNQRKITAGPELCPVLPRRCSTPYGNQRKITPPKRALPPCPPSRCSTPYGNQRKITAHPRILTLQGSDGAFASMYPYSIHQLPARRQVS